MYLDLAGEMFFNFFVVDFLPTDERYLSTHKPPAINTFNFLCMPLHSYCQKQWCNLLFIALPMTSPFAVLCSNLTRVIFSPLRFKGSCVHEGHLHALTEVCMYQIGTMATRRPSHYSDWRDTVYPPTHRPTHTVCWYRYPTHSEQSVVQLLTGLQWLLPCVGCITTMVVNLIVDHAFGLQLPLGTTGHLEVFVRTSRVHGHP